MKKKLAFGIALFAVIIISACIPPLEDSLEKAAPREENDGTYLQIQFVRPDGTPVAKRGVARSLTVDQQDLIINYYEIITHIQDQDTGGGSYIPVTGADYNHAAYAKTQGWASVPVREGYRYQVLLLEGWKDSAGGDPVLLRSSYGLTGTIAPGPNTVLLYRQEIQVNPADPDAAGDTETGYRFYIDSSTAYRPKYKSNNGGVMTVDLPLSTAVTPIANPKMTMAIEGAIPLMLAKMGDISGLGSQAIAEMVLSATAANTFFDREADSYPVMVTRGINVPQTVSDNQVIGAKWTTKIDTGDISSGNVAPVSGVTGKPGRILLEVGLSSSTGELEKFLMPNDDNGSFFFDARYYGFSLADAKDRGFTRWAIRNGLSYYYYDKQDATGGALSIKFGNGGGSVNPNDQPTTIQSNSQILVQRATVALTGSGTNAISYVITPSIPPATYKLYYDTTPGGTGSEITIPPAMEGTESSLTPGTDYFFTVVTTFNGNDYNYQTTAPFLPGNPVINLSTLAGGSAGRGWAYSDSTKVVTLDNPADVTVTGTTTTAKIVAPGAASITLNNASIDLSGAAGDASAIKLTGASTLNLKEGSVNTLIGKAANSAGGMGIELSGSAALTVNGPGALTVSAKGAASVDAIGIGGTGSGGITITGGVINATGWQNAAIGGSSYTGAIEISGGYVTAKITGTPGSALGVINGSAVTLNGTALVTLESASTDVYCLGNGSVVPAINDNAIVLMSASNSGKYLGGSSAPTTPSGLVKYGNAWHVYGSPTLKHCALTIGNGQTLDFYPNPAGIDSNGIPTGTLTTTSSSGQALAIDSGAILINDGTVNRRGADITTANGGKYTNRNVDNQ